jgi:hypothetical protein
MTRSCLHCSLSRALEAEWTGQLAGPIVRIGRSDPLWLPIPGRHVYRALRRLLHAARQEAADTLKLTVLDLPGKSHVEVMATVGLEGHSRSRSIHFPRHDPARLPAGFAETLVP